MYDPPKAAHFDVIHKGQRMNRTDPFCLNVRWQFAEALQKRGVNDMMRLSAEDQKHIDELLVAFNGMNTQVVLRED